MKIIISLILFSSICQLHINAQSNDANINSALLIIDIQEFYFPGQDRKGLVNAEEASLIAQKVLETFRINKQLVVHIKHKSDYGFEIHPNVMPLNNEKVITKEEVSCFSGTDLLQYLKTKNINRLFIIGMQTHMCLEAAVRAAHDLGFDCIVIEDACATRDLNYNSTIIKAKDVHMSTLATLQGGGYAEVINSNDFLENPEKFIFSPRK